jgi:vacuolar-type H+-ATPase catalytic subunit A/Vma1
MLPPKSAGTITFIASKGQYTLSDVVLETDFAGEDYLDLILGNSMEKTDF